MTKSYKLYISDIVLIKDTEKYASGKKGRVIKYNPEYEKIHPGNPVVTIKILDGSKHNAPMFEEDLELLYSSKLAKKLYKSS